MKYITAGLIVLTLGTSIKTAGTLLQRCAARHKFPAVGDGQAGVPPEICAVGYVEAPEGLRHLSFQIGGVIERCTYEIGDEVRRGDVLMALHNSDLRAALQVAHAQLQLARAKRDKLLAGPHPRQIEMAEHQEAAAVFQVDYLTSEFARCKNLVASNTLAESEFRSVSMRLEVAQANSQKARAELALLKSQVTEEDELQAIRLVKLARAQLNEARSQLDKSFLRAPFDGVVLDILRREGEGVDGLGKSPVLLFGRVGRPRIRAEVDECHVRRLRQGMQARISGHNLQGHSYTGRISLVKPRMGTKTVFKGDGRERRSLDIAEVLIDLEEEFSAPAGLLVDVTVDTASLANP